MSVIVSYLDPIWIFQQSDCNLRLAYFLNQDKARLAMSLGIYEPGTDSGAQCVKYWHHD